MEPEELINSLDLPVEGMEALNADLRHMLNDRVSTVSGTALSDFFVMPDPPPIPVIPSPIVLSTDPPISYTVSSIPVTETIEEFMDVESLMEEALEEMEVSTPVSTPIPSLEHLIEEVDINTISSEENIEEVVVTSDAPTSLNIPVNSATISRNEVTSRFSSALWAEKIKLQLVTLAGIGGIGSYVAYLLSRLDIGYLTMYDDDRVETVNLSGQMFKVINVGQPKVSAMNQIVGSFSNFYKTSSYNRRFDENTSTTDIMICGFDNMLARKAFFTAWRNRVERYNTIEEKARCLFIDGRLAAEEYQVFCIKGDDSYNIERYMNEFLFTDAEAEATICSYKQTSFMANQIASTMVNLFVNHIANQCEPLFDRDVPFYTTYDGITMYFKTEM